MTTYNLASKRQHPKTIDRVFTTRKRITALNLNIDGPFTSFQISSVLSACLTGGKYNGQDLPLEVSNGNAGYDGEGIVTGTICDVYDASTKRKLTFKDATATDREVYGRIRLDFPVWEIFFFFLDGNGAELPASVDRTVDIDFDYACRFEDLPVDFATAISSKNVYQDLEPIAGLVQKEVQEKFTIAVHNQIPALKYLPLKGTVEINFNGHISSENKGDFTIYGNDHNGTVTFTVNNYNPGTPAFGTPAYGIWNPLTSGFSFDVGDVINVSYKTYETVNYPAYTVNIDN